MAKVKVHEDGSVSFKCPGCGYEHRMHTTRPEHPRWEWNGDLERPTLKPSILMKAGHYMDGRKGGDGCWCKYNAEHPEDPNIYGCVQCHSFVTDGRIQFLSDSSHHLAGQTVDMLDEGE